MIRNRSRGGLAVLLLAMLIAGCASQRGGAFAARDFGQRRVRTIAVLPIWNQTEVRNKAFDLVRASLESQLRADKHFAVVPFSKVRQALAGSEGGAAFGDQIRRLDSEDTPTRESYQALAHALEADAVLQETVIAYHATYEDGIGVDSVGGLSARNQRVGVISLRGELFAGRDGEPIWRNQALGRYELASAANFGTLVFATTRDLLANLPVNSWAPEALPPATPVPVPVTSLRPFPQPADPLEP